MYLTLLTCLPDRDDFSDSEMNAVHLCYEYGGDSFVESRSVHIDSGTNCHDEPGYTGINLVVLL